MKKEDPKDTEMKKEIGRRFNEFRQFIKKRQEELAEELKVSQGTIANIESGKFYPNLSLLHYLYSYYNLSINWLLTGSDEMIISPVKKSKYTDITQLFSPIEENDPRFEKYVELISLMRIPVIKEIIFGKLAEIKALAKEEIKSFFEET